MKNGQKIWVGGKEGIKFWFVVFADFPGINISIMSNLSEVKKCPLWLAFEKRFELALRPLSIIFPP